VVAELEFIRLTRNHGEYCEKLRRLGEDVAADAIAASARYIALRWLELARDHLQDAKNAYTAGRDRSLYSRCYYAVYNASKCVRYLVDGAVSLKGDDHQAASELPDDFPDVDMWSSDIVKLYEHRLVFDYDNWRQDEAKRTLSRADAIVLTEKFLKCARNYLMSKYGMAL
jgi:hypothetical protein